MSPYIEFLFSLRETHEFGGLCGLIVRGAFRVGGASWLLAKEVEPSRGTEMKLLIDHQMLRLVGLQSDVSDKRSMG